MSPMMSLFAIASLLPDAAASFPLPLCHSTEEERTGLPRPDGKGRPTSVSAGSQQSWHNVSSTQLSIVFSAHSFLIADSLPMACPVGFSPPITCCPLSHMPLYHCLLIPGVYITRRLIYWVVLRAISGVCDLVKTDWAGGQDLGWT